MLARQLVFPLALALAALGGDGPRFEPEKGASFERRLERKHERKLVSVTLRADGQERRIEDPGFSELERLELLIADEFRAVEAGRVTELVRKFEKLQDSTVQSAKDPKSGETHERELKESCDLEGERVRFESTGKGEWKVRCVDAEDAVKDADEKQLGLLEADMDLAELLPGSAEEREKGWKIDIDVFKRTALRPGGRLRLHGEKPRPRMQEELSDSAWDSITGAVEASWNGEREEHGTTVYVIALAGKLSISGKAEKTGDEPGPESVSVRVSSRIEGELLWDKAGRRAHALHLELENQVELGEKGLVEGKDGEKHELERVSNLEEHEELDYSITER